MHFRAALLGVWILVALAAAACGMHDFGERQPDKHIQDRAGVLTPSQIQALEQRASELERRGAPNVAYIRVRSATQEQTRDHAGTLMSAWHVQSSSEVQDGFVILINLVPEDMRHSHVGIWAGAAHARFGGLLSAEVDRIASDIMRPALLRGDVETAIAAGLDAATERVRQASAANPPGWSRLRRLFGGS
jgi:uncharacterized membrane protein YgcG